jgi:hypothetical protein
MLPLFARTGHDPRYASPSMGTLVAVDRSELAIRMCLVAPSSVQRAAQVAGVKSMVMIRPKGIEKVEYAVTRSTPSLILLSTRLSDIIEGLDS